MRQQEFNLTYQLLFQHWYSSHCNNSTQLNETCIREHPNYNI